MSDSALYQQIVLDHYRKPRNRGALTDRTHAANGANPLCGDSLRVEVRCSGVRVVELRFSGEACAITTATASMLSELASQRTCDEIVALASRFEQMINLGGEDVALGPLNAMRQLQRHPARRPCAMLPWATLRAALAGVDHATTQAQSA